jgi:hypothetical protein
MMARPSSAAPACVVCGLADARALTNVRLSGGARAVVCGSHALMHRRRGASAATPDELRRILRDRRTGDRRAGEQDELAAMLTAAFAGERRLAERRSG